MEQQLQQQLERECGVCLQERTCPQFSCCGVCSLRLCDECRLLFAECPQCRRDSVSLVKVRPFLDAFDAMMLPFPQEWEQSA